MYPIDREGTEIFTNTPQIRKYRKTNLELLLSNHDKKCLSCPRNDNCELQKLCLEYGVDETKFQGAETKYEEDHTTLHLVRNNNKCILCRRCVAACNNQGIGVIGANGSGKSSLFKILAGVDKDFSGETKLAPGYTIGYLEQEPQLTPGKTVLETVKESVKEITALLEEFDKINEAFGDPDADIDKLCARQGEVQEKLDALDAWNLDNNLELAMDALRCPPPDQIVDVLSGGERRRVALCRLLLQKPDILLLDEPTNHLDAETVAWLEKHLHDYPGTVIAVTHDRYFLDEVAGWILELDRGEGYPFKGNYTSWLEQKNARLAQGNSKTKRNSARTGMDSHGRKRSPGKTQGTYFTLQRTYVPGIKSATERHANFNSCRP